jgi:hypothetical protein
VVADFYAIRSTILEGLTSNKTDRYACGKTGYRATRWPKNQISVIWALAGIRIGVRSGAVWPEQRLSLGNCAGDLGLDIGDPPDCNYRNCDCSKVSNINPSRGDPLRAIFSRCLHCPSSLRGRLSHFGTRDHGRLPLLPPAVY